MFLETKELVNKCLAIDDPSFSDSLAGGEGGAIFLPTSFYDAKEVFTTNSCGTKNTQSVSLKTGLLKVKQRLFTSAGSRLPFNLSVSYNQEYGNKLAVWDNVSPLVAPGWKFNYQQSVKIIDGFAYYCDGDFNLHKLQPTADKYFEKETGLILTVKRIGDLLDGYEITDGQNTKLIFNFNGNLTSIQTKNGTVTITTTISYNINGKIIKVIDGLGKVYTFTYSSTAVTISNPEQGTVCALTIAGSGLEKVSYINGANEYNFVYTNGLPTITDALTQTKTSFSGINKISSIVNYEIEDDTQTNTLFYRQNIAYYTNKAVVTHIGKNATEDEHEQVYYYFATNGELIHTSDDKEDLLENLTVESAKTFKETTAYEELMDKLGVKTTTEEYEVISLPVSASTHTQTLGESALTWYDTEDTTFDFIYNGSEISNVKFTLADYIKTMLSKFKSPTSFNFWYNDGENLITDCSVLSIRPHTSTTNELFTNIKLIKYASLTVSEKAKSYSYISSVTSTQLTISEYLYIGEEYKLKTSVYNTCMQLLSETDYQQINKPGIQTKYTYDSYGDCTKTETNKAGSTNVETKLVNDYTYTNGKLTSEKGYYKLLRPATSYAYGLEDSISQITDPNGNIYTYGYLGDNETFKSISSGGITNNIVYNHGRVKKLITNNNERYLFEYNNKNKLDNVKPYPITEQNPTILQYNAVSKKKIKSESIVTEDIDSTYELRKHYDEFSRLRKITQVKKDNQQETPLMYYFYWDDNGWTSIKQGDEQTEEDVIKNILSKNKQVDPFDSRIIASKQAKLRVVLDKTSSSDYNRYERYNSYGILYDSDSNLQKIIYPNTTLEYSVEMRDYIDRATIIKTNSCVPDEFRNTYPESTSITNELTYYDNFSNKVASDYLNIYNSYFYHKLNEITKNLNTYYTYDDINRVKSVTISDGTNSRKTEYSFIPAQEEMQIIPPSTGNSAIAPAPIRVTNDIGTTNFIGEIKETGYGSGTITTQVEYDKNGNITKYGDNTYVYDDLNRLVRENNLELGKSFLYGYDNRGNLCTKFEFVYSTDETLTNSLTSKAFIGGTWDDQLDYTCVPQTGEKTYFTYDNSGRTLTIGNSQSFTWNEDGSLNSSSYHSILGTTKTEYVYDNSGNRVALVNYAVDSNDDINSHKKHFRYLNGKLVYQVRETIMAGQHDPINFVYNTTGLIGFFYNHELYTYRKNLFGDITEIYKGSELVAKYIYDAWGNHKVCNPDDSENPNDNFIGNINPFRYRGYYYDIETGLYYLKSRYYSPKLGRFISPDSVEYLEPDNVNGLNLYAYCYNNPIMYVDNMGYYPEPIILFAEIISGFAESIGQLIWKQAENYLKNPITMKQAQKIIRKNGLKQSARSLLRAYSNDAFDSLKFGKTLNKFGSILSTGLLLLDIGNTIYNNYESKSDTWLSESIVDVGYTLIQTGIATFCTIYIPAIGWLIGIGANLFLDYIMEETNLIDNIKSWITQYDN